MDPWRRPGAAAVTDRGGKKGGRRGGRRGGIGEPGAAATAPGCREISVVPDLHLDGELVGALDRGDGVDAQVHAGELEVLPRDVVVQTAAEPGLVQGSLLLVAEVLLLPPAERLDLALLEVVGQLRQVVVLARDRRQEGAAVVMDPLDLAAELVARVHRDGPEDVAVVGVIAALP